MNLKHFALVFLFLFMSGILCVSQTAPPPTSPDATAAQAASDGASQTSPQAPAAEKPSPGQVGGQTAGQTPNASADKKDTTGTSKDRLFFALPNFLSVEQSGGQVQPLTVGQKFKVVARSSFDPVQIVWYGALSGISQAENSEPGFGQGAEGYGKRYGAYAADGTIENFFVGAILPSVFRQDPRFFPKTTGGFFNRTGYAVSRIVVTRGDSGRKEFNFSEVFGSATASAISTYSYHPRRTLLGYHNGIADYAESERTLKNAASVWGSQVGYDTITLVIKEFWPDLRRKLKKQPQ